MGFVEFSSANADYIFHGVNHFYSKKKAELFENLDILITEVIVENGDRFPLSGKDETVILNCGRWRDDVSHDTILRNMYPILCVDAKQLPDKKVKNLRAGFVPGTMALTWSGTPERIPQFVIDSITEESLKRKQPISSGRSALAAEKIEEGIVPKLQAVMPEGVKPRIGLIYGAYHLDMIHFIQDRTIRREVFNAVHQMGWDAFDVRSFDILTEYRPSNIFDKGEEGYWQVLRYHMDLFDLEGRILDEE